jgi:hypothetical protein
MSTTTVSDKVEQKQISLGDVIDNSSPFLFLYEGVKVDSTPVLKSMSLKKKLKERVEKETKLISDHSPSILQKYIPSFFQATFPKQLDFNTVDESMDTFVKRNRDLFIPNKLMVERYTSIVNYNKIISTIKDVNDYITFFQRTYNSQINEDKKQMQIVKDIASGKCNAMLMSGKLRALKTLFDEVEMEKQKEQSLFNYYHSENHVYKVIKFLVGTYVYESTKTLICSYTLDSIQATSIGKILGPFASAPIYIIFNFANIYRNLGQDERENQSIFEKTKYALIKGGFTAIVDVLKITIFPMMGLSMVQIVLGNMVIEGIMAVFDPKLDKKRSDDLAKSYGEMTLDKNFIKNILNPPKAVATAKILSILKLPLDWVATFPEAVTNYIFNTMLNTEHASFYLSKIPGISQYVSIMKYVNKAWKLSVYAIGAFSYFCLLNFSLKNYTMLGEYYSHAYNLAVQSGIWNDNIISTIKDSILKPYLSDNARSALSICLNVLSLGFGYLVHLAEELHLEKGILEFAKNLFFHMCENHKEFVRFLTRSLFSQVSPTITTFLKANTQHYLSFAAPALFAFVNSNPKATFSDYSNLIDNSIYYGGIAVLLSVGANILTTTIEVITKNKQTITALKKIDEKYGESPGTNARILYEKLKFTLGNSLIFNFLDNTASTLREKFFGNFLDYVEVKFGRKDFFKNLNVTEFTNRILVDAYIQINLQNAVVDLVSNSEVLYKLDGFNDQMDKEIKIDRISILDNLARQKELDNQRRQLWEDEIKILQKTDQLEAISDIKLKLNALDEMQNYYQYVSELMEDPFYHFKSAEKGDVLKSILFNHFNPFVRPVNEEIVPALENDFKVQTNNLINIANKNYLSKLQDLELQRDALVSKINRDRTATKEVQESALRLNETYKTLKQNYLSDPLLKNITIHLQTINDLIINEYNFNLMKNSTDIYKFYERAQRVLEAKKKIKTISQNVNGTKLFTEEELFSQDQIDKLLSSTQLQESSTVKDFKDLISRLKEKEKRKGKKETVVKTKEEKKREEKGEEGMSFFLSLKGIYDIPKMILEKAFLEPLQNVLMNFCKTALRVASIRKTTFRRSLDELQELESRTKNDDAIDPAQKLILLSTINDSMEREIAKMNSVHNMVYNVFQKANNVISVIPKDKIINKNFSQSVKTITEKTTKTFFSSITDVLTSIDFATEYDTAFGADPELSANAEMPFTGDEIKELEQIDNVLPFVSGNKVNFTSPGLEEMTCVEGDQCKFHNEFIRSLDNGAKKVIKDVQKQISDMLVKVVRSNLSTANKLMTEKQVEKYANGQLFLAYYNPELRQILSKLKLDQKQTQALKNIFMMTSTYENRGRYFRDHFEGKELDWSNPFLLYFFSNRQYARVATEEILGRNNMEELAILLKPIDDEIDVNLKLEAEFLEKIKSYEITIEDVKKKVEQEKQKQIEEEKQKQIEEEEKMLKEQDIEEKIRKQENRGFFGRLFQTVTGVTETLGSVVSSIASTAQTVASLLPASHIVSFVAAQIYGSGVVSDSTQDMFAKIQLKLEGIPLERNVGQVDKIITSQIETIKGDDRLVLLELKAQWLKHANKVDDLIYQKELKTIVKSNEWKGENYAYNRFYAMIGGNLDFTGVMSPNMSDVNGLFFADDEFGLKKQFIELEENASSENLKQFVRNLSLVKPTF